MNKQFVRNLISVIVLLGLFTFPAFAGNATSTQPVGQQSVVAAPALTLLAEVHGNPHVKVWVNTNSGVYHCPGARWYGNTKVGEFMTQKQAQEKGYRPAYGKFCQ
jgi:hypothetical protein